MTHLIFCLREVNLRMQKKPDFILLDINIPIFNGHEVLKQIKADSNLKKNPGHYAHPPPPVKKIEIKPMSITAIAT